MRPFVAVFALLSLGACTEAEQKSGDAILSALGVTTSVTPPEPVELLRMIGPEGSGPMGEEIWTGPGCTPLFRVRICQ